MHKQVRRANFATILLVLFLIFAKIAFQIKYQSNPISSHCIKY